MGQKIWKALLVLALTTASSLQFAVIDTRETADNVAPPDDSPQNNPATWRRSGGYRLTRICFER